MSTSPSNLGLYFTILHFLPFSAIGKKTNKYTALTMKPKFILRLRSLDDEVTTPSTPTPPPNEKKKYPRHLSLHHERELKKKRDTKKKEIEAAVAYCRANNCKGYKAIADLNLEHCKDARTINHHIEKEVVAGGKQKILTEHEEITLARYLINRNRACQGLNDLQVAGVVLNILRVRRERNRRLRGKSSGWSKYVPLSDNAQTALDSNKVSRSFFRRFRTAHPEVKPMSQHKVSLKRGLRCTMEMAIDYLDELAKLLIEVGIAPELKQTAPGVWVGAIDVARIWAHDETRNLSTTMRVGSRKRRCMLVPVTIVPNYQRRIGRV